MEIAGIQQEADHGLHVIGDDTMERLTLVAKKLRREHAFRGYIHLKTIPLAAEDLVAEAGRRADRLSVNIELATMRPHGRGLPRGHGGNQPISLSFRITADRGRVMSTRWCLQTIATFHPSAILRARNELDAAAKRAAMVADLKLAQSLLTV